MSVYIPIATYVYQNGAFMGGLVEDSPHKDNCIFIAYDGEDENGNPDTWGHELTLGEALVLANALIQAAMMYIEPVTDVRVEGRADHDTEESNNSERSKDV